MAGLASAPQASRALNRSIHLRYVTERGLELPLVAAYLGRREDLTIRILMERVSSWNLAGTEASRALLETGDARPLDP